MATAGTCVHNRPDEVTLESLADKYGVNVKEFSQTRAREIVRSSPLLSVSMGDVDNVTVKAPVNGSSVYFKGTWSEWAALSVPADICVHDELDRSIPDTLQVYSDRLMNSDDPRTYLFSTPTLPGHGISEQWSRTDQNEWMWTCPHCDADQAFAPMDESLRWFQTLDVETEQWRCAYCGGLISREVVEAGEWVAFAPEQAERAGYHITGIMPPQSGAHRVCEEYREARTRERFLQGHIGIPAVAGEGRIAADMIAFGDWANQLASDKPLYAGVDQGRKLDFIAGDGQGRIVAVHRFDDWSQVAAAMTTLKVRLLVAASPPAARKETKPDHFRHAHTYYRIASAMGTDIPSLPKSYAELGGPRTVKAHNHNMVDGTVSTIVLRPPVDPTVLGQPLLDPSIMYPALRSQR